VPPRTTSDLLREVCSAPARPELAGYKPTLLDAHAG
jgi:hypothetical protein